MLRMVLEEKSGKVFALHNGVIGIIPMNNIACMVPEDPKPYFKLFDNVELDLPFHTNNAHAQVIPIGAQVEDPSTRVQNPPTPNKLK